jgi:hypothetical protein
MAKSSMEVINSFIHLLLELSQENNQEFSGAGFVLYSNLVELSKYHCSLVRDELPIPLLKLGMTEITSYLLEISNYNHPYHDGFHFINCDGAITHVAQFLSPPVNHLRPSIEGKGARTFCSQCASNVEGVLIVGSVSSNRSIHLFEKGKLVNGAFLPHQ